jgi:hypothetical protein
MLLEVRWMARKLLALVLAVVVAAGIGGCTSDDGDDPTGDATDGAESGDDEGDGESDDESSGDGEGPGDERATSEALDTVLSGAFGSGLDELSDEEASCFVDGLDVDPAELEEGSPEAIEQFFELVVACASDSTLTELGEGFASEFGVEPSADLTRCVVQLFLDEPAVVASLAGGAPDPEVMADLADDMFGCAPHDQLVASLSGDLAEEFEDADPDDLECAAEALLERPELLAAVASVEDTEEDVPTDARSEIEDIFAECGLGS